MGVFDGTPVSALPRRRGRCPARPGRPATRRPSSPKRSCAAVRQSFEQKGQLPTERPLLDDTGAGLGREAQNPGTDGAIARVTYLEPEPALMLPADTALAVLVKRRAELEMQLEELKARKESTPTEQYDAELEKVLVEIARISAQIRAKS